MYLFLVLENTLAPTSCRLEPSIIILTPPLKVDDFLYLTSETDRSVQYQLHCQPEGLKINPKRGILDPKQEIVFSVTYSQFTSNSKTYKVSVSIDHEILESLVKIKI